MTYHHQDLGLSGEFHSLGVHLGVADGDCEMMVDICFLSQDDHLDDAVHHGPHRGPHGGCGLSVVWYGELMLDLHSHGPATFGPGMLGYASETASLETHREEVTHFLVDPLTHLQLLACWEERFLEGPSSASCILNGDFETRFLPEILTKRKIL